VTLEPVRLDFCCLRRNEKDTEIEVIDGVVMARAFSVLHVIRGLASALESRRVDVHLFLVTLR
jgi:hypothetical protein